MRTRSIPRASIPTSASLTKPGVMDHGVSGAQNAVVNAGATVHHVKIAAGGMNTAPAAQAASADRGSTHRRSRG